VVLGVMSEERNGDRARVGCADVRLFRVERISRVPGSRRGLVSK